MKLDSFSDALPRSNLVELVMSRVEAWIQNGDLKPGDKLPSEKELCDHFRVSRSVVREAVSRLNALQIIETHQGRGSYVAEKSSEISISVTVNPAEEGFSQHLWELRQILEPAVAGLAAKCRTLQDLSRLEGVHQAMQAALGRGDLGAREDDLFHRYLAQATHNPLIEQIAENIARVAEPYKRLALNQPFRPDETRDELMEVLKAVQDGDSEKARQAMERHISNSIGITKR